MAHDPWNRCCYCGRFISFDDFTHDRARGSISYSYHGDEIEEFWHAECDRKEIEKMKNLIKILPHPV